MKKIIFLLLLAQTISFLYADSNCRKYSYRWGVKAPENTKCYCDCKKHKQAHYKCLGCNHNNLPTDMKINTSITSRTKLDS